MASKMVALNKKTAPKGLIGDTSVVVILLYVLVLKIFVLLVPYVCFHIFS